MKKKLRRSMIIGSIVTAAAIALPTSVYASYTSFQPLNLAAITGESLEDILLTIPSIISDTKDIFRSISTGNLQGSLDRILGVLGELGIVDPAYESSQIGTDPENPYSAPRTPGEVYDLQRQIDIVRSGISQQLSQIVFGPQGQKTLADQSQSVQEAQQTSLEAQQGVVGAYQESAQQSAQNVTYASNVEAYATQAQTEVTSQNILKLIAAQNQDLAKISSGNSAQTAQLGKAGSYQSAQLSAANAQLSALNDKTQTLAVLGASQNYQATQINAELDQQNHYQQIKDSLQHNATYQSSSMIYIPGLLPEGYDSGH